MFGLVPFKFNNGENNRGLTINDMFNDFFNDNMLSKFNSNGSFKTDIKETPEEYIVHAELPGVKKEDIKVDYNNNYLTISATRNNEFEEKKDNYIRRERSYGSVSRGFYISNVNKDSIKAKFDNGVLNIELPKKELTANNSTQILIE
ncbi:Hsp20/alpha crystallin family protein [Clostridium saudiense]|uniref:Hsp20/alpha crystallin family protein n=1 Tax=Clostridium saudiense TaxID=1414720 RepID=UPI0018AA1D90|nr:Hsp20/alpha crystallin family protein [Clostridium saudiense]